MGMRRGWCVEARDTKKAFLGEYVEGERKSGGWCDLSGKVCEEFCGEGKVMENGGMLGRASRGSPE